MYLPQLIKNKSTVLNIFTPKIVIIVLKYYTVQMHKLFYDIITEKRFYQQKKR